MMTSPSFPTLRPRFGTTRASWSGRSVTRCTWARRSRWTGSRSVPSVRDLLARFSPSASLGALGLSEARSPLLNALRAERFRANVTFHSTTFRRLPFYQAGARPRPADERPGRRVWVRRRPRFAVVLLARIRRLQHGLHRGRHRWQLHRGRGPEQVPRPLQHQDRGLPRRGACSADYIARDGELQHVRHI